MERLTERSDNSDMVWFKDHENGNMRLEPCEMTARHSRMAIEKLAAYEDAEEQKLLLRLPCKVGDTVYKVNKASKKISKHKVLKIEIEKMEGTAFTTQIWFENHDFTFSHRFGEVIFFSRAEAEAKLKEMEEKDV